MSKEVFNVKRLCGLIIVVAVLLGFTAGMAGASGGGGGGERSSDIVIVSPLTGVEFHISPSALNRNRQVLNILRNEAYIVDRYVWAIIKSQLGKNLTMQAVFAAYLDLVRDIAQGKGK